MDEKMIKITIRLPKPLFIAVKHMSADTGLTLSQIIEVALKHFVTARPGMMVQPNRSVRPNPTGSQRRNQAGE